MKLLRGTNARRSRVAFKPKIERKVVFDGVCFYLLGDPNDDVRIGDLVRWTSPKRVSYAFAVREQVEPGRWHLDEFC